MYRKMLLLVGFAAFLFLLSVSDTLAQKAGDKDKKPEVTKQETVSGNLLEKASTGPVPEIYFPDSIFDFGEVAQVTTLVHKFKVINRGEAPLKIDKVRAS